MARHRSKQSDDDEQDQQGQPGQVEGSPATAPPPDLARPYEGGEPKRHPDTGEPQGVDDPIGDPARQPQPGDRGAGAQVVDDKARLTAENEALRRVVANLGGYPDEVAKAATAHLQPAGEHREGQVRKLVSVPNSNLPAVVVSYDPPEAGARGGDAERAEKDAAVNAYKNRLGVWALPSEAQVSDPPEQSDR